MKIQSQVSERLNKYWWKFRAMWVKAWTNIGENLELCNWKPEQILVEFLRQVSESLKKYW